MRALIIALVARAVATGALKLGDIKITSDDPALQSPFAKTMIKQMVDEEMRKYYPAILAATRAEKGVQSQGEKPTEQTLEIEMQQTAGQDGEKLKVVVVSTWADGRVTRESLPDEL